MNIIVSKATTSEIFKSMPIATYKIFMIQNSPDNPFITGNICYCHIYKLNQSWGTIIAMGNHGDIKSKTISNNKFGEWA